MTNRVFLLEEPRQHHDFSDTRRWGELVILFPATRRRPSIFQQNNFIAQVIEALEDAGFDPATDHILMAGSMWTNALVVAAVLTRWLKVPCLTYASHSETYLSKMIDTNEILDTLTKGQRERPTRQPAAPREATN